MEINHFIGVDVSKGTLDFSLAQLGKVVYHLRVPNSNTGIVSFIKEIKENFNVDLSFTIFCMEHNGIYNNILLSFLKKLKTNIWVESALQIKQSQGMMRGKNDKVDSGRIAMYAYRYQENYIPWNPPREVIIQIKQLLAIRSRVVEAIKQLSTPIGKDAEIFFAKGDLKLSRKCCDCSIKAMKKDVKAIEKQIKDLIQSDTYLNNLLKIITSVDGIGLMIATTIIVTTNEFKNFSCAKKFACYSGVVPFEHSSGSSIKKRPRVSHLANKTVKKMIHLATLTGIRKNGEFRDYYERKKAEGKHTMSVLNAIRNKLILRIFACVRDNRLFEKKHQILLA
ncbi:IS110 family transposase [Chryseobacterium sp. SG20098]|uniref:IS110 family transposase n=1 Tax=Chryseobacterium sp. SG20098 TaxID=3074145 RepID=UPI002882D753|nr:IS110 family transposase [Chryseobacterium sp. SG20098]WNI34710.1 IS110 family transposase [Chryseobacterium sp. SG20098]WNI37076.1 IS110 family transposase [Chryseobacterium sp. SG20098]